MGFSAPHPGFSIVPRPARDLPPAVKMVIQKEKKSCGQVVEEWKEFVWNPRTHQPRFLAPWLTHHLTSKTIS